MSQLTTILAILIISSAMITTSEGTEDSVPCLARWSACELQSNLCCQGHGTENNSSAMVEMHCDYLQTRTCVEADRIYRYKDVLLIEKLKDDDDFPRIYAKFVEYLEKIEERLVLKRFMDRMYESKPPARDYGYGKI